MAHNADGSYRRQCSACSCLLYPDEPGSWCADCAPLVRVTSSQSLCWRLREQPIRYLAARARRIAAHALRVEREG